MTYDQEMWRNENQRKLFSSLENILREIICDQSIFICPTELDSELLSKPTRLTIGKTFPDKLHKKLTNQSYLF